MANPSHDDVPPPSYEEAVSQSAQGTSSSSHNANSYGGYQQTEPVPPPRPPRPPRHSTPGIPGVSDSGPPMPPRPSVDRPYVPGNGLTLPFKYPKYFICHKCKNTGIKGNTNRPCMSCWNQFYLKNHAFNPNPSLPFRYPKGYLCKKCFNTGTKASSNRSCSTCWELFAPRSNAHTTGTYQTGGGSIVDSVNRFVNDIESVVFGTPSSQYLPGHRVYQAGDPSLGGTLCGRCQGRGTIRVLLDVQNCHVCQGVGRVYNR